MYEFSDTNRTHKRYDKYPLKKSRIPCCLCLVPQRQQIAQFSAVANVLFCHTLATGLLCSIASAIPFRNGSKFRNSLPLRIAYFCRPLLQAFCAALPLQSLSATAANSAILCRCGSPISAAPLLQAFCAALPLLSLSTTAPFSAICCRCGTSFSATLLTLLRKE